MASMPALTPDPSSRFYQPPTPVVDDGCSPIQYRQHGNKVKKKKKKKRQKDHHRTRKIHVPKTRVRYSNIVNRMLDDADELNNELMAHPIGGGVIARSVDEEDEYGDDENEPAQQRGKMKTEYGNRWLESTIQRPASPAVAISHTVEGVGGVVGVGAVPGRSDESTAQNWSMTSVCNTNAAASQGSVPHGMYLPPNHEYGALVPPAASMTLPYSSPPGTISATARRSSLSSTAVQPCSPITPILYPPPGRSSDEVTTDEELLFDDGDGQKNVEINLDDNMISDRFGRESIGIIEDEPEVPRGLSTYRLKVDVDSEEEDVIIGEGQKFHPREEYSESSSYCSDTSTSSSSLGMESPMKVPPSRRRSLTNSKQRQRRRSSTIDSTKSSGTESRKKTKKASKRASLKSRDDDGEDNKARMNFGRKPNIYDTRRSSLDSYIGIQSKRRPSSNIATRRLSWSDELYPTNEKNVSEKSPLGSKPVSIRRSSMEHKSKGKSRRSSLEGKTRHSSTDVRRRVVDKTSLDKSVSSSSAGSGNRGDKGMQREGSFKSSNSARSNWSDDFCVATVNDKGTKNSKSDVASSSSNEKMECDCVNATDTASNMKEDLNSEADNGETERKPRKISARPQILNKSNAKRGITDGGALPRRSSPKKEKLRSRTFGGAISHSHHKMDKASELFGNASFNDCSFGESDPNLFMSSSNFPSIKDQRVELDIPDFNAFTTHNTSGNPPTPSGKTSSSSSKADTISNLPTEKDIKKYNAERDRQYFASAANPKFNAKKKMKEAGMLHMVGSVFSNFKHTNAKKQEKEEGGGGDKDVKKFRNGIISVPYDTFVTVRSLDSDALKDNDDDGKEEDKPLIDEATKSLSSRGGSTRSGEGEEEFDVESTEKDTKEDTQAVMKENEDEAPVKYSSSTPPHSPARSTTAAVSSLPANADHEDASFPCLSSQFRQKICSEGEKDDDELLTKNNLVSSSSASEIKIPAAPDSLSPSYPPKPSLSPRGPPPPPINHDDSPPPPPPPSMPHPESSSSSSLSRKSFSGSPKQQQKEEKPSSCSKVRTSPPPQPNASRKSPDVDSDPNRKTFTDVVTSPITEKDFHTSTLITPSATPSATPTMKERKTPVDAVKSQCAKKDFDMEGDDSVVFNENPWLEHQTSSGDWNIDKEWEDIVEASTSTSDVSTVNHYVSEFEVDQQNEDGIVGASPFGPMQIEWNKINNNEEQGETFNEEKSPRSTIVKTSAASTPPSVNMGSKHRRQHRQERCNQSREKQNKSKINRDEDVQCLPPLPPRRTTTDDDLEMLRQASSSSNIRRESKSGELFPFTSMDSFDFPSNSLVEQHEEETEVIPGDDGLDEKACTVNGVGDSAFERRKQRQMQVQVQLQQQQEQEQDGQKQEQVEEGEDEDSITSIPPTTLLPPQRRRAADDGLLLLRRESSKLLTLRRASSFSSSTGVSDLESSIREGLKLRDEEHERFKAMLMVEEKNEEKQNDAIEKENEKNEVENDGKAVATEDTAAVKKDTISASVLPTFSFLSYRLLPLPMEEDFEIDDVHEEIDNVSIDDISLDNEADMVQIYQKMGDEKFNEEKFAEAIHFYEALLEQQQEEDEDFLDFSLTQLDFEESNTPKESSQQEDRMGFFTRLGLAYHYMDDLDNALDCYDNASREIFLLITEHPSNILSSHSNEDGSPPGEVEKKIKKKQLEINLVTIWTQMAMIHLSKKHYRKANNLYDDAHRLMQKVIPDGKEDGTVLDHPNRLLLRHFIGILNCRRGKYEKSLYFLKDVFDKSQKFFENTRHKENMTKENFNNDMDRARLLLDLGYMHWKSNCQQDDRNKAKQYCKIAQDILICHERTEECKLMRLYNWLVSKL